ncbi:MAG: GNAT family N-acetyltransferase [Candidatus Micrarchaeota archaeon]
MNMQTHRRIAPAQERVFTAGGCSSPSIGSVGLAFDRINNRIKGIHPELIGSEAKLTAVLDQARSMAQETGATRATVRFFLPRSGNEEVRNLWRFLTAFNGNEAGYTNIFEAVVPFSFYGGHYAMAYLAMNAESRLSPQNEILHELSMARLATMSSNRHRLPSGYRLRSAEPRDVSELVDLYRVFTRYLVTLDHAMITNMVANTPTIVSISQENRIAAALAAEHVRLNIGGLGMINLIEVSEAATAPQHRGRGLYSHMTRVFFDAAVSEFWADGLVMYAEARAAHPAPSRGLLNAGGTLGGFLNKQCVLESDRIVAESGPYENLNVVYFDPGAR